MRLSEKFVTIQGEGPNVGRPTTFLRFAGCNLTCPGWPCDTAYSWDRDYSDEWTQTDPDELVAWVLSQPPRHVSLTGGEPLTQRGSDLENLARTLLSYDCTLDLFTNGTRLLPGWARFPEVTVVMDFKLPSSGEFGSFNMENVDLLGAKDAVKFVTDGTDREWRLIQAAVEADYVGPDRPQVLVGPVWGTDMAALADRIAGAPPAWGVRMNVQAHRFVFPPGVDGTSTRTNQPTPVELTRPEGQ